MFKVANDARFWDRIARKYAADTISDMAGYERTLERTRHYLDSGHTGPGVRLRHRNDGAQARALRRAHCRDGYFKRDDRDRAREGRRQGCAQRRVRGRDAR